MSAHNIVALQASGAKLVIVGLTLLAVGDQTISDTVHVIEGVKTREAVRTLVLVAVSAVRVLYTAYLADIVVEDVSSRAA